MESKRWSGEGSSPKCSLECALRDTLRQTQDILEGFMFPILQLKGGITSTISYRNDFHFSLLLVQPTKITRKCKHTFNSQTARIN